MKQILITGITGFIGQHLVTFLKNNHPEYMIAGIGRHTPDVWSENYHFYEVDLLCESKIQEVMAKVRPDYVIHLAGLVFSYDWEALYATNVLGTIHLLEAIKKLNANTRIVIAGSAAEYGAVAAEQLPIKESLLSTPKSPYGMTKLWQTNVGKYYSNMGQHIVNAKIFNLIAWDTAPQLSTGDLFTQIQQIMQRQQEPLLKVGNLNLKRDFLDVEDVCSGLVALMKFGMSGGSYNVCSGVSTSLNQILDWSLLLSGLCVETVVDKNKLQNIYIEDIYGCNEKIKKDTGWNQKITLDASIKKALKITHD